MKHRDTMSRLALLACCLGLTSQAWAQDARITQPAPFISYQGSVSAGSTVVSNGDYPITVALYGDELGTKTLWKDTYVSRVTNGIFNIALGSGKNPLPNAMALDNALWVGISFNNGTELRPLSKLGATSLAINVTDHAITTNKLADKAVTREKIGAEYIGSISIDGQKVSSSGGNINFVSGNGFHMAFDPGTSSVLVSSGQTTSRGKGSDALFIATNPCVTNNDFGNPLNTISGGCANTAGIAVASGNYATVSGGQSNSSIDNYGAIVGGLNNTINGDYDFIGGGEFNGIQIAPLPATAIYGTIGGGRNNRVDGDYGAITGGQDNLVQGMTLNGTIGGGMHNTVGTDFSTVGGGNNNWAGLAGTTPPSPATVAGGIGNLAQTQGASIGGGAANAIIGPMPGAGDYAAIPGGQGLHAYSYAQAIVGAFNDPSRPYVTSMGASDAPLFVVGNGTGPMAVSNAFEVSYNGHATPMQVYGNTSVPPPAPGPVRGASYNDNALNAWGEVNFPPGNAPSIINDFGVWEVDPDPTFTIFTVWLNCPSGAGAGTINNASITVTGIESPCIGSGWGPGVFTVTPVGCTRIPAPTITAPPAGVTLAGFDITCYNLMGVPTTLPFFFKVAGR